MFSADQFFQEELNKRKHLGLYRSWGPVRDFSKIDFYSNDYLGFAHRAESRDAFIKAVHEHPGLAHGATGSRLISGQSPGLENLEAACCRFFEGESAVFLPNGYLANVALLSSVATRHDTILYDEQVHVSLKIGIRLANAQKLTFRHNSVDDLRKKIRRASGRIFVVVESIYSMDGDLCPLSEMVRVATESGAHLIVDEAHSTGVIGETGSGLCIREGVQDRVWARVYTFGKALGTLGAVLILTKTTREYLINKAHPVIYSTAPLPYQVLMADIQLNALRQDPSPIRKLQSIAAEWCRLAPGLGRFTVSLNQNSPVQFIEIPGNENALSAANRLSGRGFQIKAMLSPTVKSGSERLRISLHSYNSVANLEQLLSECGAL